MRSSGCGKKASLPFCASQVLQETSQIHTMFPSAAFCQWISKRSDRCVNSHQAKNCPGIIQLCTLKSASYSSINLWTKKKKSHFKPSFPSRCIVAQGHLGLISHCYSQTDPILPIKNSNAKKMIFFFLFFFSFLSFFFFCFC